LNPDLLDIKEIPQGISFKVKVQPRSSRNAIAAIMGNSLKIQLTSPPVDGAANAACTEFFGQILGVAKSRITISAGEKSRCKVIQVQGITKADFIQKIILWL